MLGILEICFSLSELLVLMKFLKFSCIISHLYHKPFSLKKINYFTLYHNLSNINLSPLTYLEKDKIYIHKSQLSHLHCKT